MPTAEFEDSDLIEAIAAATGYRPSIILEKKINDGGNVEVIWR